MKIGKVFTAFCILLAVAQGGLGQTPTDTSPERTADAAPAADLAQSQPGLSGLEDFMDGAVATFMAAHKVPGVTVSVVYDGKVALTKGYGFADVARTKPVDPDTTLFRPGSISKTFTWVAVMQLVEQGKLDLDADVNSYLTQFQIPEAFGQPVTLRNLLTHAAGFEDAMILFHRNKEDLSSLAEALEEKMPARVRPPGTYASYSNWGASLAGLIVANVSGMDFDTYIERNIFEPLGMLHSTFREPVPESLSGGLSTSFDRAAGDYLDGGFEFGHDFGPAGGLSSTASDMAKFMLALLGDGAHEGARILQTATAQRMREPLLRQHEAVNAMLYGFYEQTVNGHFAYGHGGNLIYFHSDMVLLPEENVGLFISTNSSEGWHERYELVAAFFDRYFPPKAVYRHPAPPNPEAPGETATNEVSDFVGAYRLNRHSFTKWDKLERLISGDVTVSASPGGGLVIVSPLGAQRFVQRAADVFVSVDNQDDVVAFDRDSENNVTHLLISQWPFMAFDKLGTLEQADTHRFILVVALLVMIGVILRSIGGRSKWRTLSGGERVARAAVFGAAILNVLFVAAFAVSLTVYWKDVSFTGILPGLSTMLALPVFGAALTAIAALMMVPAWSKGYWTTMGRIRYTLVVLVLAAFAWSLNFWNLLGPWYA